MTHSRRPVSRSSRRPGRCVRRLAALAVVGAVSFAVLGFWFPTRFVTLAPGPATDVATLVFPADGRPVDSPAGEASEGRFLLTTVLASSATPINLWKAVTDPLIDLRPRRVLIPPGMSDDTYASWGAALMRESQVMAAWQAWLFLGHAVEMVTDGAEVFFVTRNSPARGHLREGDRLISWSIGAHGGEVTLPSEMEWGMVRAFLAETGPNTAVEVVFEVVREGVTLPVGFRVEHHDLVRWPFLGLAVGAVAPRTDPPVPVVFAESEIAGPSAGLMMALRIIDLFVPGDLTAGRVVAGSGTLDRQGTVGPIGSVEKKISGASGEGATIFLVPPEDHPDAVSAKADQQLDQLRLVIVGSLREAYDALVSLTLERGAGYNDADLAGAQRHGRRDRVAA